MLRSAITRIQQKQLFQIRDLGWDASVMIHGEGFGTCHNFLANYFIFSFDFNHPSHCRHKITKNIFD